MMIHPEMLFSSISLNHQIAGDRRKTFLMKIKVKMCAFENERSVIISQNRVTCVRLLWTTREHSVHTTST